MELPSRYSYNPKWWAILACFVFFGACSAVMAHKAATNSVGAILNGIITLGPTGATAFYWVISGLSAGFVVMALLLTARCISSPQVLELGTEALLLPHGRFQKQTSRIVYSDIQAVSEAQVSGQRFLYVTAGGLRFTITASLLPDAEAYAAVRDFLVSRAPKQEIASSR